MCSTRIVFYLSYTFRTSVLRSFLSCRIIFPSTFSASYTSGNLLTIFEHWSHSHVSLIWLIWMLIGLWNAEYTKVIFFTLMKMVLSVWLNTFGFKYNWIPKELISQSLSDWAKKLSHDNMVISLSCCSVKDETLLFTHLHSLRLRIWCFLCLNSPPKA